MTPLRLLLIEDSENDALLVVHELTRAGFAVSPARVQTAEGLAGALEREPWDLAIADYTMPQFSGTAALKLLRQYDPDMPFIFVSGTIGEDIAVAAMKTGAHDYLIKGHLKRLGPAVQRELREAEGRVSRKLVEARLEHMAYHDSLTDLPNRVLLHDRLQQAILAAQRGREPLSLLVLDLDGLTANNDSLGHHAGDLALQEVAVRLQARLRDVDTVARLGGDEFALLLPRTDADGAILAARKILMDLGRPLVVEGYQAFIGASVGIACFPEHGASPDTLLQRADIAMYVAKSGGLGFAVYAAMRDSDAHHQLARVTALRDGIDRHEFVLDYQPVVNLQTGTTMYVESLARWNHPREGRLMPDRFIELAERTWLIEPLTMILLERALAEWTDRSEPGNSVAIALNLSPKSLRDPDFPTRVATALEFSGALASGLVLEITENVLMSDAHQSLACLSQLRGMGITLAIDDFGAGYSSLSYLRHLPVDVLKIDRSFITGLKAGDDAIVRSTIDLAHDLGLKVVAEGVESRTEHDRLRELSCDAAQGRYLAAPCAPLETRRWIQAGGVALRM
jgi:diguanylate cyclase (GGDEF)-like protein